MGLAICVCVDGKRKEKNRKHGHIGSTPFQYTTVRPGTVSLAILNPSIAMATSKKK